MSTSNAKAQRAVYIIDGKRTPFLKATAYAGAFSASDLAVLAARQLLLSNLDTADRLDQVILGCVMPSMDETNIARQVALRLGATTLLPAWTVQRNCASGLQALDCAARDIACGRSDLILAGGCEAMSRAPLLFSPAAVRWFASLRMARGPMAKLRAMAGWHPRLLAPQVALLRGLTDPLIHMNMAQTAEYLAYKLAVTRQAMDHYAARSQQRAHAASANGNFAADLVPLLDAKGQLYTKDTGVRHDTCADSLARLKPILHAHYGAVTAGNSSQISDGAAMLLLASDSAIKDYNLTPVGRIVDTEWAGVDPQQMGVGPVAAVQKLLTRYQLGLDDIDYWEINEAFAGQVLACLKAFSDPEYCQHAWLSDGPYGEIADDKLNIDGGAIALGHPVGASGARIALQALRVLQRTEGRYAIATLCIGGGQGGAMLIERIAE